jgi:hypothetical protein
MRLNLTLGPILITIFSIAQSGQTKRETINITPENEGFELSVDIGYGFGYCPDGLNVFIVLKTDYVDVSNSKYLFKGRWYTKADVPDELASEYFDKKYDIGSMDVKADVFHQNTFVTQIIMTNVIDFGGLGCFGQTYCASCQAGMSKESANGYRSSVSQLELRNIQISISSKGKSHLSYELGKLEVEKEFDKKANQAEELKNLGDKAGALAIYSELTAMKYSSVSHEKKQMARKNKSELKDELKKDQAITSDTASESSTSEELQTARTVNNFHQTEQGLYNHTIEQGNFNEVSKVQKYQTVKSKKLEWDANYAMQSWNLFNQSETEMQNRFSELYNEQEKYSAFVSSLFVSNKLTPEGQIAQYRQKLSEIENYYSNQMASNLKKAEQFGQDNAGEKGAAVATLLVTGASVASAKQGEKDAKRQLEKELTNNFRKIQRELLIKEEPYIERNKQAAARSLTAEREAYYLNWVSYWECRVSRIKNNFSIHNTNWIDPKCSEVQAKVPADPTNPDSETLFNTAKRKHASQHGFIHDYADHFLNLALSKSPKNTNMLFTKYLWNRETKLYWTSASNPARDYLELCLSISPEHQQGNEALLWELANDDHLRSSYSSYKATYPNGYFTNEAIRGLEYFDSIQTINSYIEKNMLWKATYMHKRLVTEYARYYKSSDIPEVGRLKPIYAEIQWNYVSDKSKYSGIMGEQTKLMLRDQYNFITEYPKLSKKFPVRRSINTNRNKMAGSTLEYEFLGISPFNQTRVTASTDYFSFSQLENVQNVPIVYTSNGLFNSINLLSMNYRKHLFTISGPFYVSGLAGMRMGPFMLNKKIQISEDETNQEVYNILSDWHEDPSGYSQEYSGFPEHLYYNEPMFEVRLGLSLSNIFTVYHIRSEAPEFGGLILETGSSIFDDPVKSDPWGEDIWNDVTFVGGWGAQVDIPLMKNRMLLIKGKYETLGNKNWTISDYPYTSYNVGLHYSMVYLRYSQSQYDIIGLTRGGFLNMQEIRNISVSYKAIEFGFSLDFNMVSKQHRSMTGRDQIFIQ